MDSNSDKTGGGEETVEALKKLLVLANQEIVRNKDQIGKLSTELEKLKLDKKSKNERKKNKKKQNGDAAAASSGVGVSGGCSGRTMKNGGGGDGGGEGREEERDVDVIAIAIFPVEIWERILGMITDVKDLWNCSKTCRLFEKLVSPTRTTWMFEKIFPHVYLYLKRSGISSCRLVSKTWNEGVDTFLENHRSVRPYDDTCTDPIRPYLTTVMQPKRLGGNFVFGNSQMYQGISLVPFFEDHMKDHPRNPFVGRHVTIDEYENGELTNSQFWPTIYRFLRRWGEHIWYLTLHQYVPHSPLTSHNNWPLQKLLKFLTLDVNRLCPGLRRLRICGNVGQYEEWQEQQLELNPWTYPSRLETIQFEDAVYEEPNLLLTTLLNRYHLTLKCLHLTAKTWNNVYKYERRHGYKWENLTELHVEELSTPEDFDTLLKMGVPNLRKLGLSLASCEDWTFGKLLEVLNKVSKESYLHTLRFCGAIPMKFFEKLESDLQAPPTIKTLELEHTGEDMNSLTCYTFLVKFPFVETLNLFWRQGRDLNKEVEMKSRSDIVFRSPLEYRPPREHTYPSWRTYLAGEGGRTEVVEMYNIIYGWPSDVYKSNVWEVLPRMKVFTFQYKVYTREGYEHAKMETVNQIGKQPVNVDVSGRHTNGTTATTRPQRQQEISFGDFLNTSQQIPSALPLFSIGRSPGSSLYSGPAKNITPAYRRNRFSGEQTQSQSSPNSPQQETKTEEEAVSDAPPQKMQKSQQLHPEDPPSREGEDAPQEPETHSSPPSQAAATLRNQQQHHPPQ